MLKSYIVQHRPSSGERLELTGHFEAKTPMSAILIAGKFLIRNGEKFSELIATENTAV